MPSSPSPPPAAWRTSVLIALLCLIWGSTWLFVRIGLDDLPPFTAAAARFGIAGAVMALIAPRLSRLEGGARPGPALSLVVGLLQFGMSFAIVYWSEQTLPSGLVSVIWATFPLMVAACSVAYLPGERLSTRQWTGFVLAFTGVGLLFATDVQAIGVGAIPTACVLLVSPGVSAIAAVYVKRHGAHTSSLLLNRNGMLIASGVLGALALTTERDAPAHWSGDAWFSVLYLALVGTCVTFSVYLWLMRSVPAYRLSLVAYVTPAIALLLGTLVRGERLASTTIGGAAVILVGVGVAARRRR